MLRTGIRGDAAAPAHKRAHAPLARAIFAFALLTAASCSGGDSSTPTPTPTAPPPADPLLTAARSFPAMPKDLTGLISLRGGSATFGSGTPFNDLEYTIFDTDYMEGETSGFDTFMPIDPSQSTPGADEIKIVNAVNNLDLDEAYDSQVGDRIILGATDVASPFFRRGPDGVDNDYAVITNFDYRNGYVELAGAAGDYSLFFCRTSDGCATTGYFLFHTAGTAPDLIAFLFQCDDLAPPISGAAPRNPKGLCNSSETLSLSDPRQFRFAAPKSTVIAEPTGRAQIGAAGKEVVGGVAADSAGNSYVFGLTDGNLDGGSTSENEVFITKINPAGAVVWTRELALPNGSLIFDAVADGTHLYAAGRTLGALAGFVNAGRWDAILLKLRLSDGVIVATDQFGNPGLDGYGNVILDDSGHLFVSGAGSAPGAAGTDSDHLIAKHRASDLGNVWRLIVSPDAPGSIFVSEAWGGLSYIPGPTPGDGRLVAGGWLMSAGGANAWLEVWAGLNSAAPARAASALIASANNQADWILDNAVDAAGSIYAAGFTTGALGGAHRGNGDAFIVKFDGALQNPVFRQVGTPQSESFRKLEIDAGGTLYAIGYSYGDFAKPNADARRETGDLIVQKFDSALNPVGARQIGSALEERGYGALVSGRLFVGGMTEGGVVRANGGSFDGFVLELDPSTLVNR